MSVWRYKAVALAAEPGAALTRGEIASASAEDARSSLRRVGLQVVELRQVRAARRDLRGPAGEWWNAHLRKRRLHLVGELYDSLATLLDSGAPMLEAVDTVLRSQRSPRQRNMLLLLHEALRSGASLSAHMEQQPGWFGPDEVAMVRAGEHSGELSSVLRNLAERTERAGELGHRVVNALTYPCVVLTVGVAALIFLSTRTLPELAKILQDADVEVPALTARVMALGQALADWGLLALLAAPALVTAALLWRRRRIAGGAETPRALRRLSPELFRRVVLAGVAARLSELIRSGVPMVQALRVLAPTVRSHELQRRLKDAADRVERGEELPSALDDEHWFDPEFRRLLEIGLASGELDTLLERLAERYERRSRRLIDRLAAMLEPAVILTLALGIGVVVVAAILPMIRLQEIIG